MPAGGRVRPAVDTVMSQVPKREVRRTRSPSVTPRRSQSAGFMSSSASGSARLSSGTRRVIDPVCQCSSRRPVQNQNGYSSLGSSAGGS